MLKPDVTNFNRYQRGREAASEEMEHSDFDVNSAIASFKYDPPDNAFQHGYLRELIKSDHQRYV
tara:strand:+ start:401 stop:592 length:192 start_codon:yes stop_codon:yes gene_type:complete